MKQLQRRTSPPHLNLNGADRRRPVLLYGSTPLEAGNATTLTALDSFPLDLPD
jgi:hypothetical protein